MGLPPLQAPPDDVAAPAGFPMTLAETASTAHEILVHRAARTDAAPAQEAALIDNWLQSLSGMEDAVDLAAPVGIDLRDPAFWRAGLETFRADLARFEALVENLTAR